jgi:hypothetical protein
LPPLPLPPLPSELFGAVGETELLPPVLPLFRTPDVPVPLFSCWSWLGMVVQSVVALPFMLPQFVAGACVFGVVVVVCASTAPGAHAIARVSANVLGFI